MKIVKRDGRVQDVSFDKIVTRIKKLSLDDNLGHIQNIDCDVVSQKVIQQIYDGISTMELDVIASDICIAMSIDNYQYGLLASRISTSNLHKSTPVSFSECVDILNKGNILNERFVGDVMKNKEFLDSKIVSNRDYLFDFFGFATLTKSYLLRVSDKNIERPQYLWMRVAVALHGDDLEKVVETYENLSELNFIHATPTLFNAGTKREQMSSCFLMDSFDSVDGIFKTMGDVARISKHAGGIGLTCSRIRAKNSIIRGTNGKSDGILPMLKVYNEISRYINQAGKRNGSFAMFLETHHADIEEFLELKKNTGDVNLRARDLFYGLWVSDLFMKRVEEDGDWYLMCPDECPGLVDAYSTEFEELYNSYVEKGMYRKKMKARDLWEAILVSQTETGTPYMCYKDATNTKNNQSNLGTITSSNLCVAPETMILTSDGYHQIKDLEDKYIEVWNGKKFSKTTVKKTGTNQELLKVKMSHYNEIECTPYHKFYIEENGNVKKIEAKDLRKGMKLIKTEMPKIYSANKFDNHPLEENEESIKFLNHKKYMYNTIGFSPQIFKTKNNLQLFFPVSERRDMLVQEFKTLPDSFFEITVEDVEYTGRISDTYCFNEPERNMGIFNGILTGNCVEITLFHDKDEYAVCNISSLCLGNCVKNGVFDFEHLAKMSKIATYNLNKVIDLNYYPTPECERSNTRHRPIAIGVQGLYDAFIKLGYAFTSNEAKALNKQIFECIQYNALEESCRIAECNGVYSSFQGSPASKGMFQHNLWGIDETKLNYNWPALRKKVLQFGLMNSTLTALPPTASTASIMGNVSSFETITSNIFTRTVLSGNFPIINKYLVKELNDRGLWSTQVKDAIISSNGSVQGISSIPDDIKALYKTTWETSQKETINMSADRAPFIDQSQSLNVFMSNPTTSKLSSMHFYGWKKGLKTGMYYLRSQPISTAEQITVSQQPTREEILACSLENQESCMMCQ
jgi:ribonucleotide reductase alpha subunit